LARKGISAIVAGRVLSAWCIIASLMGISIKDTICMYLKYSAALSGVKIHTV
jgi:hypothetical protein